MEVNYRIFKDRNFFIQKYKGNWSNKDFENLLKSLVNDPDWKFVKIGLTDLREVNFEQEDINNILTAANIRKEFMQEMPHDVLLVNKPMSTAMVHLYTEEFKKPNQYIYCSSVSHAIKKLELSETKEEIENILKDL